MQRNGQMNSRRRRWLPAVAAITSLALVGPWAGGVAGAASGDQRTRGASSDALATLQVQAKGVDVNPAGKGGWTAAKNGQSLKAGDAVRTDETGSAQIAYADGSLTRLDVDTEYKLVKLSDKKGDRKTKGLQTAGQTWHRVEKLADDDSYKVEGANATAAVLGTAFVVTCVARNQCTFTAVVDPIKLTDPGPRNGTKTVTLTPGDQAVVSDDAIGPVTTLTQEELLAIQWIVENLLADQSEGKSTGTSEIASQPDPPPTRPASSPVQDPPPPAPPADTGTGTGTGTGTEETPANQGPTAQDDAYAMPEDTLLAIAAPGVLANDSDPEGTPLELFLTGQPAHGSLLVFGDGGFVYFPDADFSGVDSWTYVAGDGEFGSNPATVTITVTPQADAPVAANDTYTVDEDETLTVLAPGVLGNDTDADGNPLTAIGDFETADYPAHGSLELNPDGSFVYDPEEDFHGTDTFTYQASDGGLLSNVATVTITVTSVEDAPSVAADIYSTPKNTTLEVDAADGVLDNDSDADGTPLTVKWPGSGPGLIGPYHGTLTPGTDGAFTYEPDDDFAGSDYFVYAASDGTTDAPATVLITVTGLTAVDDDFTIAESGDEVTVPASGFLANDLVSNNLTWFTVVPVGDFAHGDGELEQDGSISYQSTDANFTGTDSIQYKLVAGDVESNVATITLHVTDDGADVPVATNDEYETNEDTTLEIDATEGVLANDSDADAGDTLTASLAPDGDVQHGTLTLHEDGSFTYVPAANWYGEDSFQYIATDGDGHDSEAATVTITVDSVNDVPVANDDAFSTFRDQVLQVLAPGVLANDTDGDGEDDTLTADYATIDSAGVLGSGIDTDHGHVELNEDGSFTYTPNEGFTGEDSFDYVALDGTDASDPATVTITVSAPNAPTASSLSYYCYASYLCPEIGGGTSITLSGTDTNEPPLAVHYEIVSLNGLGGGSLYDGDSATPLEAGDTTSADLTFDAGEANPGYRWFTYVAVNSAGVESSPATVQIWVGPYLNPEIHSLDEGESQVFQLDWTNGDHANILSVPESGSLEVWIDEEGGYWYTLSYYDVSEGGYPVAAGQDLKFLPPEGSGTQSFTWNVEEAPQDEQWTGDVSATATEFFVVGGPPVVDDAFASTPAGTAVTLQFLVHADGIGTQTITCWGYGGPEPSVGTVNFSGEPGPDYIQFEYVPPADFSGVVSFYVSACIDGAWWPNGARGYVAVNFTPDAPDASAADVPTSLLQGEDAYFTIVVNGASSSPLPTLITLTNTPSPPGTLEFLGSEGDSYFYVWHPDSEAASTTTLQLNVSNGFTDTPLTVELPYSPNVGL